MEMKPIGVSSELGGIYMYGIDYGINDYAIVALVRNGVGTKLHRLKIYYNTNEPYIILCRRRIKMSSFIRH